MSKYGAKRCEEDGYSFASLAELRRYRELKLMDRAGVIVHLEVHPVYRFEHGGVRIGRYTPDFQYRDTGYELVVEDVKGGTATVTESFRLRKKMMKAFFGIDVKEVQA